MHRRLAIRSALAMLGAAALTPAALLAKAPGTIQIRTGTGGSLTVQGRVVRLHQALLDQQDTVRRAVSSGFYVMREHGVEPVTDALAATVRCVSPFYNGSAPDARKEYVGATVIFDRDGRDAYGEWHPSLDAAQAAFDAMRAPYSAQLHTELQAQNIAWWSAVRTGYYVSLEHGIEEVTPELVKLVTSISPTKHTDGEWSAYLWLDRTPGEAWWHPTIEAAQTQLARLQAPMPMASPAPRHPLFTAQQAVELQAIESGYVVATSTDSFATTIEDVASLTSGFISAAAEHHPAGDGPEWTVTGWFSRDGISHIYDWFPTRDEALRGLDASRQAHVKEFFRRIQTGASPR